MKKPDPPPTDPLVDEVRATRKRLVRERGGLSGWVAHLRKRQEQHPEKIVVRGKQAAR